jgi:hypothetical protein
MGSESVGCSAEPDDVISMVSGVSVKTGEPFIHYKWGDKKAQFTVDEFRRHGLNCIITADAAEMDSMIVTFLEQRMSLDREQAGIVIADLRNFRVTQKEK